MTEPELLPLESIGTDVHNEWRDFVASTTGSFFQTPDWIRAWAGHLVKSESTTVALWRDPTDQIEGVAALSLVRERLHRRLPIPIRYVTNSGSGPGGADNAGWTARSGRNTDVLRFITQASTSRTPVLLQNVDEESLGLTRQQALGSAVSPRLLISGYLAGTTGSQKLKKAIRRERRRLDELGVTLEPLDAESLTSDHIHQLISLHGARRDMKGDATTFTADRLPLHAELIRTSTPSVGPRLVGAFQDGRLVAGLYGFMCGEVFSYYQSGWWPDLAKYSIGSVLVDEAIRYAGDEGAHTFDFLRGAEPYKYRFGATDRTDLDVLLTERGLAARILAKKRAAQTRD